MTWPAALPGAPGRLARLADVLGADFRANAVEVRAERDGVVVEGYAGLPTHSRANSLGQYLFVNGRPVRDKLLIGVMRGAYADYLPRDRHPVVALFVTLPPREVDVNVHPAKTEVRFRDNALVRALLMHALKEGLARDAQRAAIDRRHRDHRGVPPGDPAPARQLRLAALAVAARCRRAGARGAAWSARRARLCRSRAGGVRRRLARPPPPASRSPSPRPTCSTGRSAPPAPRCTTPTSWRRPATAWSSSISTPPTSGWSTSA